MATSTMAPIIQHLRAVLRPDSGGLTDGQVLGNFVVHGDETAFAVLMQRHGPMVFGVCRRLLGNAHDAEDAFQATFLVLARKASSVAPREQVGNWLYGVARTTALRAKVLIAKRRLRERQVTDMPEPQAAPPDLWDDLQPLLDQELSQLPDKYRVPVLLCDLEGRTRKEVARQLKVPEGTISSRLATARKMLARRLARHGLVVAGGALAALLSQQASAGVPAALTSATRKAAILHAAGQAAAGAISAPVAALTEGVLKAMLLTKLKQILAVYLVVGLLALGVGLATNHTASGQETRAAVGDAQLPRHPVTDGQQVMKRRTVQFKPGPADYNALFDRVLDVLGDYFKVDYANRSEGRIETSTVLVELVPPRTSAPGQLATGPALRRRALVQIRSSEEGGFAITVRVVREAQRKVPQEKTPGPPADGVARWEPVGRDTELEQVIVRRLTGQQIKAAQDGLQRTNQKLASEAKDKLNRIANFYQRTGHPGAADFYRRLALGVDKVNDAKPASRTTDQPGADNELPVPRSKNVPKAQPPGRVTANLAWDRLGLKLAPVGPAAFAPTHPELHGGMRIVAVRPTSPAFQEKLQPGDILVGLHEWEMLSQDNVVFALGYCQGASLGSVRYVVVRGDHIVQGVLSLPPGGFRRGISVNSDAGLTGSIVINERNYDIK